MGQTCGSIECLCGIPQYYTLWCSYRSLGFNPYPQIWCDLWVWCSRSQAWYLKTYLQYYPCDTLVSASCFSGQSGQIGQGFPGTPYRQAESHAGPAVPILTRPKEGQGHCPQTLQMEGSPHIQPPPRGWYAKSVLFAELDQCTAPCPLLHTCGGSGLISLWQVHSHL